MPYYYWDPTYILVLIGALLSVGASALVNRTFNRYSSVYARSGLTGAQLMSVVMQCSMRKAMCRFLFEAHSFQLSILVLICHGR